MKFYSNTQIAKKIEYRNNIKKVISIITYPVAILIVLLVVYSLIQRVIEKNSGLHLLGFKTFVVKTGSMEKNIGIGDLVFEITPYKEESIKVGNIVSVNNNGNIITHRIINIEMDENGRKIYTTKGDNNDSQDKDKVKYENIVGVYLFKIPKIGEWISKIRSIQLIVLIGMIMLIIYWFIIKKESKEIIRHEKRVKLEGDKK